MRFKSATSLLLPLSAVLLTACSAQHDSDLQQWAQERKALAKPRVQALQDPSTFKPQAYEGRQSLDPFNMLKLTQVLTREAELQAGNNALLANERSRRKEELENYPLDSMAMVGSIRNQGQATALLRVNQMIYQVKAGDHLGQNYGQVVQVDENSIKLREVVQDAMGNWVERITTLDLQEGSK